MSGRGTTQHIYPGQDFTSRNFALFFLTHKDFQIDAIFLHLSKEDFYFFYKVLYSTLLHLQLQIPSDSTVSEDARIEPRTVAMFALEVRRCITAL
jgi:hypothetical protein